MVDNPATESHSIEEVLPEKDKAILDDAHEPEPKEVKLVAKSILVSKMFWFNAITMMIAFLESQDVINVLPAVVLHYAPGLIAAGNIVLRYFTRQPVALIAPTAIKTIPSTPVVKRK